MSPLPIRLALLSITITAAAPAQPGRIVVVSDEYPLSNARAHNPPNDAGVFAGNVAAWFTGGQPGSFLAATSNHGLLTPALRASMEGAGHTWTVSASPDTSLANLLNYDAIFLAGAHQIPAATIIDYIEAGGCLYVAAGAGTVPGGAVGEANFHNQYLLAYGLQLGAPFNNAQVDVPVSGTSPLLAGVDHLYSWGSSPLTDATPDDDSSTLIFVHSALQIGIYSAECQLGGDVNCDCAVDLDDLLVVLANFGLAGDRDDGDVTGDGDVDLDDLLIVLAQFGAVCA